MAEMATIARPYAEALFKAGGAQGIEQNQSWLEIFAQVATNEQVLRIAQSPKVSHEQVAALFEGVAKEEPPALLKSFLVTVIANGRLAALPQIAKQYRELVNNQQGISDGVIYSAFPLSEAQLEELRPALEKHFERKLNLTVRQDESLIGGVRVVVGDEQFDDSIKARLKQMKVTLTA